jgi:hypothetical protein
MATGFLFLLDDITNMLGDVAALSKLAVKKTTGVIGDDLALNAHQVNGAAAERELPIIWAVAKGSIVNKAVLVPVALLLSALAPGLISPLLMTGGAYLCYEGSEKIIQRLLHGKPARSRAAREKRPRPQNEAELLRLEKAKIKGAIKTDFVLSAEIIVIALGTVAGATLPKQLFSLALISLVMTAGVYGVVAVIIKIDDFGFFLQRRGGAFNLRAGGLLLKSMPLLMKFLSVAGTAAMFLVGGGIINHGLHPVYVWLEGIRAGAGSAGLPLKLLLEVLLGFAYGALLCGMLWTAKNLRERVPYRP